MLTLDEMLTLLPDNTAGEISAADLRDIVTSLHGLAELVSTAFSYQWAADVPPANGTLSTDAWSMAATEIFISNYTQDEEALTYSVLDGAATKYVLMSTTEGSRMRATITGPSVDQTTYRVLPISVDSKSGPQPSAGQNVTLTVVVGPL